MSQIVGYVHENMDRYMLVSVFEAWAAQRATAAERDQWRPVTWADGQGNEPIDLRQPRKPMTTTEHPNTTAGAAVAAPVDQPVGPPEFDEWLAANRRRMHCGAYTDEECMRAAWFGAEDAERQKWRAAAHAALEVLDDLPEWSNAAHACHLLRQALAA